MEIYVLEFWKLDSSRSGYWPIVSDEKPLPGLTFYECKGAGWGQGGRREKGEDSKVSDVSSYKDTYPIGSGSHPHYFLYLNYLLISTISK